MTSKLSLGTVERGGEGREESAAMLVSDEVRLGVRGGEKASSGSGERRSDVETLEVREGGKEGGWGRCQNGSTDWFRSSQFVGG